MSAKVRIGIVMLSACVAFYAIAGGFPWDRGATAKGNQWAQLRIFDEVLFRIVKDYVDEPDMERVRLGALRGLAEGLDPYSAYLTPAQVEAYKPVEAGLHEVSGMALSKYGGYVYVVSVLPGSAAEKAGVSAGDIVEYIGKAPTRDMSLYDAEMLLTDANKPVEVKIFRGGQTGTVTINPAEAAVPAVEAKILETGVGYVRVHALTTGRAAEVKQAIDSLTSKGARRLVLDLRGSAVGTLEEGAALADLFVDEGVLARKIGKGGADAGSISATPGATVFRGPLSVVMDTSTAGGAEVAAAALLASKRAEIAGERSFGAGVELGLFRLRDGGAMLITVAKFAPPTGKPFLEEGVTPTVEVKQKQAEVVVPEDDAEEAPAEEPTTPEGEAKSTLKAVPRPAPADDLQLKKAVELVKANAAAATAKAA
jgi:carboxyl-terminal processing protease